MGVKVGVGGRLRRAAEEGGPAQAPRRFSAPPNPHPSGLPPLPQPSLPQRGNTALDKANQELHTEVIRLLENAAAIAAQVGRAAPHPPPRRTAPAPCATDACSRIPGCSLTARSRPITLPQ